jgi:ribonuclease D
MTTLINDTVALKAFCERHAHVEYLAIDTEFTRQNSFWPKLCLWQIAGPDEAAVVDPLAPNIDLHPALEMLQEKSILKVFHSARQDIEIFVHLTGKVPTPLFDTQVAAMVCGFGESVSYETLAIKLAGVSLDKSLRFADWSCRPLTNQQLRYALDDVVYLRPVYEKLRAHLSQSKRDSWLNEEMAVLTNLTTYTANFANAWRKIRTRSSDPRFLSILRELAAWRESEAQKRDVPRSHLLRDEVLLEIAAHTPRTTSDLVCIQSLNHSIAESSQGLELLAAVERGLLEMPSAVLQTCRKQDLTGLAPIVELLRVLLKMVCKKVGVAQKLVATVADLEAIAADDNAGVPALRGWRRQVFGEDALALKHGQTALCIDGHQIKLVLIQSGKVYHCD